MESQFLSAPPAEFSERGMARAAGDAEPQFRRRRMPAMLMGSDDQQNHHQKNEHNNQKHWKPEEEHGPFSSNSSYHREQDTDRPL
jgi:hypothetical protein